jgi:hypothetical protein
LECRRAFLRIDFGPQWVSETLGDQVKRQLAANERRCNCQVGPGGRRSLTQMTSSKVPWYSHPPAWLSLAAHFPASVVNSVPMRSPKEGGCTDGCYVVGVSLDSRTAANAPTAFRARVRTGLSAQNSSRLVPHAVLLFCTGKPTACPSKPHPTEVATSKSAW